MPDVTGLVQACEPGPGGNWNEVNWNEVSWPVPGANGDTFASDGIVSDINGAMAALETGDDTFASTGEVQIVGAMAAAETGDDIFAATGEAVETGVMHAIETGDDVFAATGEIGIAGSMAAHETGADVFAATGIVEGAGLQRGGYGKDYRKPKQREFDDEVSVRQKLRRVIREAIEPVRDAATVLAAQDDEPGVAVVTESQSIRIAVPPSFSAAQVARMVTAELERAEVAVRTQRAKAALETMIVAERARVARLRREEEELLLLA